MPPPSCSQYNQAMELLPEGTANKNDVTFQDQQQINRFSTLMTKFDRLNEKLKKLQSEKEQIDDVSLELELVDEDELVDYLIGGEVPATANPNGVIIGDGCFVKLKQSQVMEKLQEKSDKLENEITETETDISSIEDTLKSLKSTLYAKFGNSINLEK